jgi:hypothetical protein
MKMKMDKMDEMGSRKRLSSPSEETRKEEDGERWWRG